MSAGTTNDKLRVHDDLGELAPLFRAAVERAIEQCNTQGLDAYVYEAYRSQELAAEYYARGRTKRPPLRVVTNAPTNLHSWHGFGLAVDVISRSKRWGAGEAWFRKVADVFKANECKWGGDWKSPDMPHFQWHKCKASPSMEARSLLTTNGVIAVWQAVGALASSTIEPAPAEERKRVAVVTASALNLRPDPSTRKTALRVLPRGTVMEVIEPHGEWFRVRVDGVQGYVNGNHTTLCEAVLDAAPCG